MLHILTDTSTTLEQLITQKFDKIVLYFTATWCGPCKLIAPVVEELANGEEYKDTILFVKIDVDECEELMEQCDIKCMPTFQFYEGGKKIDTLEGCDKEALRMKVVM